MSKTYTTGKVAKICDVSPKKVANWIDSGKLKGYRLAGSQDRRVTHEALVEFMQANNMPLSLLDEPEAAA